MMKRRALKKTEAFSLIEVLVALALASMVFGALLSGFGRHVQSVANLERRYRNLVVASAALEKTMDFSASGDTTDTLDNIIYTVTVRSMPSDPRIDCACSTVKGDRTGQGAAVSAYRLRGMSASPSDSGKSSSL
ncbi:type II secretion system protein [bacterium]|nr:type II secretion system protein [bacterium]